MKGTDGVVDVLPGAPRAESQREFVFVMIWSDLRAFKDFVGKDYTSTHIDPAEEALVEHRLIRHCDLVEA